MGNWLDRLLAEHSRLVSEPTVLRGRVLLGAAQMAWTQDDITGADRYLAEALDIFQALNDSRGIGRTLRIRNLAQGGQALL